MCKSLCTYRKYIAIDPITFEYNCTENPHIILSAKENGSNRFSGPRSCVLPSFPWSGAVRVTLEGRQILQRGAGRAFGGLAHGRSARQLGPLGVDNGVPCAALPEEPRLLV